MTTIHVVPYQHFDIVWRRNVNYYIHKREQIYKQALELLHANRDFTFTFSQTYPIREFLINSPEYKHPFQDFLKSGRLEIIGGMETIPDLNMCSGTAIVRNIEAGLEWLRTELDYVVQTGCFEDAFGVSAQFPGILNLCGYKYLKTSRMPRDGQEDACGNFRWRGKDGTLMRCISPISSNLDWGWGYPDNPDEKRLSEHEERRSKIASRLMNVSRTGAENILYVVMGEEHDIYQGVPDMLQELNRNSDCKYVFSTFSRYYQALTESSWGETPIIESEIDLSRLFTGCYASRPESKMAPRHLEHKLIGTEMSTALSGGSCELLDSWRKLFVMQFHDAICGCHIAENARYLKRIYHESLKKLKTRETLITWKRLTPDFEGRISPIALRSSQIINIGNHEITVENNLLLSIKLKGKAIGRICSLSLKEDSGTLWTEEYSGREYTHSDAEQIVSMKRGKHIIEITTEAAAPAFKKMWPGFSHLKWIKKYRFHDDSDSVMIILELDWLGNSTEISLQWDSDKITECSAEIPFGSISRGSYIPSEDTMRGESFPVCNWVRAANFAVFNRGTPGCALRNGRLESILLRSPVKRWSPWFPVTPEESCWSNGKNCFAFLWVPVSQEKLNSDLHRMGIEFNLHSEVKYFESQELKNIPTNLVLSSLSKTEDGMETLLFEADGKSCVWKNTVFGIRESFNPYDIKKVRISKQTEGSINAKK